MKTKEITVVEYIKTTLLNDIDYVRKEKPYLAFFLIASAIEFLGKCMSSSDDWHQGNMSQYDFEHAICGLSSLKEYKKYTSELKKNKRGKFINPSISLYKHLRCGLVHAMLPEDTIILSNGANKLEEENGHLTIYIDTFYDDFKKACDELIAGDKYWNGKKKDSTFFVVDEKISEDGQLHASTGKTSSINSVKQ